MAELVLKNICKLYEKGMYAVKDFSLEIEDGDFVILVGPSGCGKSTTLRMIAGLEEISSGELWIDGRPCNHVDSKDRELAMVFQNYALYPNMTVYDNIAFSLSIRKVPKEEIRKQVLEVAKILEIEGLLDRRPKDLSGGQKQRVAIGSAIIRNPKALLMDEPLSNLDAKLRARLRVELAKLHKKLGLTIIYVTHDQTEAMTLGNKIVVLKDGVIQQADTPKNLYEKPVNQFVATFIGSPAMNLIDVEVEKIGDNYCISNACFKGYLSKNQGIQVDRKGLGAKEFTLGIRPEDLYDADSKETYQNVRNRLLVSAKVLNRELLGAEIFLYVQIGKIQGIARVEANNNKKAGDFVELVLDMDAIHLFHPKTEENLFADDKEKKGI